MPVQIPQNVENFHRDKAKPRQRILKNDNPKEVRPIQPDDRLHLVEQNHRIRVKVPG